MSELILLDTRGLLLRDHHSSNNLSAVDENGTPVQSWQDGLTVFINKTILPLIVRGHRPLDIIACWDGGNTFRRSIYPNYKQARRDKERSKVVNEILAEQRKQAIRLLAYLGIKSCYVPGEEADDLIALMIGKLEYSHATIDTVDADMLQLVSPRVSVQHGGVLHSVRAGTDYKGVPYPLVAIYKALCGDKDEYPGVPNFGPKSFFGLLERYGQDGVEEIQQALSSNVWAPVQAAFDATKDKALDKILQNWSTARMCLNLAILHPEACYGNNNGRGAKRPTWTVRVPNREKVLDILKQMYLEPLMGQLEHLFPTERLLTTADSDELVQLSQEILTSEVVSWDYETTDKTKHAPFKLAKKRSGGKYVDVLSQELTGISINFGPHLEKTIYIPVDHKGTDNFSSEWVTWLLEVLDSRTDRAVAQNVNFELTVSEVNLGTMPKASYDTSIMASYVDENEDSHLKGMSLRYLGYTQETYTEVTQGRDMCDLTGDEVLSYGCDDSLVTSHLFVLFRLIMQLEGSWRFYCSHEVDPATNTSLDFIDGQAIDYPLLNKFKKESEDTIQEKSERLRHLLEKYCSPESGRSEQELLSVASVLYDEWLALPSMKLEGGAEAQRQLQETIWEKAWNSLFYVPFEAKTQVPEFVSTPTMVNRVIGIMDSDAPKIGRASAPGVVEWESAMVDYIGTKQKSIQTERLQEFTDRLYAARKALGPANRSGDDYEALEDFCNQILREAGEGKQIKLGDELNTNSDQQMQALLYGKLGLPIRKRSKVDHGSARDTYGLKGAPATGLKAIAAAFVYDLAEAEDDWRKEALECYRTIALEQQNQSLYYVPYPLWAHPRDGRIHPQIRNCGTATRRPAGNDPNVLQASKKDDAKIRKIYLANGIDNEPRCFVSADFSNQELVIVACESEDPVMLDAFMSAPRKDLHSLTPTGFAHILLPRLGIGWSGDKLTYDQFVGMRKGKFDSDLPGASKAANEIRNKFAKATNFLIAYLGTYYTLASNLLISEELAKQLMDSTFLLYPRLHPWQEETVEFARTHGYTETAYGNRRHASKDLWSSDKYLRRRQERQLVNAPVQSTAADILKVVQQFIFDRKMRDNYRMRAVKPVYDEIAASIPLAAAADYCEELNEGMSVTPPGYPVGMQVEFSIGKTWGGQTEIGLFDRNAIEEVLETLAQHSQQS